MTLNNNQIYEYAQNLSVFINCDMKLPVKVNFFLQKNIQIIINAAKEIEAARLGIAKNFGNLDIETNAYQIPKENINQVNQELIDLFSLEQDLPITLLKLNDFVNIELTYQQMSAIMFMVEED